jgi:alpha-glucoside transport system substrate-binding protein
MIKRFVLLAVIAVLVISLVPTVGAQDLSGTTITVLGQWTDETEVANVTAGYAIFEERTGATVEYTGLAGGQFETLIVTRVEAGDPPDIACFAQPGKMGDVADALLEVDQLVGEEFLSGQYDQAWLDMVTFDGRVLGIWGRISLKSLVWYSPPAFDTFGYEVPETWAELIDLSEQIVDDGFTPWYAPMESGGATGWVGTDWIEDILLRTTSLENYDAWTVPQQWGVDRLKFASPEVTRAFELMGDIMLNEDYMYGGTEAILGDSFFDSGIPLLTDPPNAFLVKQGSSMPGWLDETPEVGPEGDLNYFYFPPIDEEYGRPALVAGDVCGVFSDRPEVVEFAKFLATAESLEPWLRAGGTLAPHSDVDLDWYPPVDRGVAEILASATAFRFDGGDLQPAAVGQRAFWDGVVNYISGDDLSGVLENIDAAWPEE